MGARPGGRDRQAYLIAVGARPAGCSEQPHNPVTICQTGANPAPPSHWGLTPLARPGRRWPSRPPWRRRASGSAECAILALGAALSVPNPGSPRSDDPKPPGCGLVIPQVVPRHRGGRQRARRPLWAGRRHRQVANRARLNRPPTSTTSQLAPPPAVPPVGAEAPPVPVVPVTEAVGVGADAAGTTNKPDTSPEAAVMTIWC